MSSTHAPPRKFAHVGEPVADGPVACGHTRTWSTKHQRQFSPGSNVRITGWPDSLWCAVRVPARRGVAAADVAAGQAQPQLYRVGAVPQTLRTGLAERDGLGVGQRVGVRALFHDCQITTDVRTTARKKRAGQTWT